MTYEIAGRQVIILAVLVLYLGYFVTRRAAFLRDNNIPVAVTGGFLFSIAAALMAGFDVAQLKFDLELRNLLLLIFFTTIGLNAKFRELAKGGLALVLLVIACGIFLVLQNALGVSIAALLGRDAVFGLFGGSISLAGGHGTAIAWGEVVAGMGISGAAEFGIACATFGLILGGLLGGPIAGRMARKIGSRTAGIQPVRAYVAAKPDADGPRQHRVTADDIIATVFAIALCLGIGDAVNRFLFDFEIRLPGFLTAMMAGVVITNLVDPLKIELNREGIDLTGNVSLQLFLAMSLMSMDLLSLADSAVLLLVVMAAQVILAVLFATQVVFRLMGRDYDAAVMVGGFFGLGLGATPVAMASMDAVTSRHGPSLKALLVVPLVGAFFIDLINAVTIELFLKLPFLQ